MPEFRPFRALRFNPDQVADLATVLAPPYDVISPEAHEGLLQRDPHNVVWLTLPAPGDPQAYHAAAAERFRQWQAEGMLIRDQEPALYLYSQTFPLHGHSLTRTALFGAVRLSPFGQGHVRPHERTHSGPKLDRLKLMHALHANLSPIFGLAPPSEGLRAAFQRARQEPIVQQAMVEGERHALRRLTDPELIRTLCQEIGARPLYIADGHHRYETAVTFRDEVVGPEADEEPPAFVMMAVVPMDDPGLVILPAHRLVQFPEGLTTETFVQNLRQVTQVDELPAPAGDLTAAVKAVTDRPADVHRFAVYLGADRWLSVKFSRQVPPDSPIDGFDVVTLQQRVLEPLLGIDAGELDRSDRIAYTPDAEAAVRRVDAGEFSVAFFIQPPAVAEVQAVADAGQHIPQKGTYFFPKLITGMVIADLRSW